MYIIYVLLIYNMRNIFFTFFFFYLNIICLSLTQWQLIILIIIIVILIINAAPLVFLSLTAWWNIDTWCGARWCWGRWCSLPNSMGGSNNTKQRDAYGHIADRLNRRFGENIYYIISIIHICIGIYVKKKCK